MVKFSVLLPTRNRLELLKYAVNSVLQQEEEDFEIIISDNYSDEDIAGYARSLNDCRIKYYRTDSFVSVTDNWNNAMNKSSGDWIIMLGDDDCLMKGYFSTVKTMLEAFPNPDFIYMNAFLFAYPEVLPDYPEGLFKTFGNAGFVLKSSHPYWLPKDEALRMVKSTFNFTCEFGFNMQFALMNRSFVEKLRRHGNFFSSPYPDYYAMTAMMLLGERILACPYPLVTVGISSKSFGFYYFNNSEKTGVSFLNSADKTTNKLKEIILPGTAMNTSWLLSLEDIKSNFKEGSDFLINYQKYRSIQIIASLRGFLTPLRDPKTQLKTLWSKISLLEKCLLVIPWYILSSFHWKCGRKFLNLLSKFYKTHSIYPVIRINDRYENIQQFFEKTDPFNFIQTLHD